jgi:excisionase family DNA binding protein
LSQPELTLQEAADALGVHYMTAYRYVRLGLLDASKSGGTWRVRQSDLDAFRSSATNPVVVQGDGRRRAPWAGRLQARLIAGDSRGAWGVVEAALAAGADLEEVYVEVLGPAMAAIGAEWEAGQLDISVEHRATGIAMRIIGRLGPRFVRRGRTRGVVIVSAPAGERHSLPVAMLADLVRGQGWEVSDLGADCPDESLVHAAMAAPEVVAVGLSVTTASCLDAAASALAALRAACPGVLLVLGGRAVRDHDHAVGLGADAHAADGPHFVRLLEERRTDVRLEVDDVDDTDDAADVWGSAAGG